MGYKGAATVDAADVEGMVEELGRSGALEKGVGCSDTSPVALRPFCSKTVEIPLKVTECSEFSAGMICFKTGEIVSLLET